MCNVRIGLMVRAKSRATKPKSRRRPAATKRKPCNRRPATQRRPAARQGWLARLVGAKPVGPGLFDSGGLGDHRYTFQEELTSAERMENRIQANVFRDQKRKGTGGPIFRTVLDTLGQADPRMHASTSFRTPRYWQ